MKRYIIPLIFCLVFAGCTMTPVKKSSSDDYMKLAEQTKSSVKLPFATLKLLLATDAETIAGTATDKAVTPASLTARETAGVAVGREFSTLSFTNAATQTAFSEANMLAYSAIDNQGAGEETDVILVAVSYPIKFAVETSEAFQIELCPPSGEIFTHDGTALDANDCILSSATVGSSFMVKRRQIADASWQYFTYTIQGVNTDTGATD